MNLWYVYVRLEVRRLWLLELAAVDATDEEGNMSLETSRAAGLL